MKLFKAIATLGVVGGIVYVIYRSYQTYKAETEGGISGEDIRLQRDIKEAKETVNAYEVKKTISMVDDEDIAEDEVNVVDEALDAIEAKREMAIIRPQIPLEAPENMSEEGSTADDYFDEEEAICELDDSLNIDGIFMKKKEEKLRHNPDSKAAIDQYKLMIMSDFERDPDIYDALLNTWGESFVSVNERDDTIRLHIYDERCRFFGERSIYTDGATMTELFIFYANKLSYDYGVDPVYALRSIFFTLGINDSTGQTEITNVMRQITHHDFVNKDNMYGLFGLPMDIYESRIRKYPQVILSTDNNEDVGFDMEYNVFCDLYGDAFADSWVDAYEDRVKGII